MSRGAGTGRQQDEVERLRRRVEAAEAELREFAHALSHDLRTPLAAVTGYLELLALRHGDALPEEGRDFLSRADTAARRLGQMLTGLSVLAQLPTAITARPIAWREVVDTAIAELPDDVAGHVDRVTVAAALPRVDGDAAQLGVLVRQLLDNALRHHDDPSSARVTVRVSEGGALVVEDDGPGIAARYLDRVHQPFKIAGQPGPTGGVGLTVAMHIAELHGGNVTLAPSAHGGLRVSVRLGAAG